MSRQGNVQAVFVGLSLAVVASLILYQVYNQTTDKDHDNDFDTSAATARKKAAEKSRGLPQTQTGNIQVKKNKSAPSDAPTPLTDNTSGREEKALHSKIEELDKKGKALFKDKRFLEAAEAFTEALDLIAAYSTTNGAKDSASLTRQVITLTNNRSAIYEKGNFIDLALLDCANVLEQDPAHTKARTRTLRILESQQRYQEALVQICALQLKFMQENRTQLRMGIPLQPPVSQQKLEEIISKIVPGEVDKYLAIANARLNRPLPSKYTLTQLLKSFSGYNAWMSKAARNGTVSTLTAALESEQNPVKQASILLKRGLRHVHDKSYEKAADDFEAGLAKVEENPDLQDDMENDDYARLLEWVGMSRHWKFNLEGALKTYQKCTDLEPTNTALLVKQAGVKMDGGQQDEALEFFDMALGLDPNNPDALLHRANLRLLQQNVDKAKTDLLTCLQVRPDHLLARLRLAALLMAVNDVEGTREQLKLAKKMAPDSSEVHSFQGELHFTQGELEEAKAEFEKAIECEPSNPTPYVNLALAIMNTPPNMGGPPDVSAATEMLEKAIQIDPQMHSAYMHLGQLKLAMATDLSVARSVLILYDQALEYCRTADEMRDICGVRVLTQAQVDAATMLKMETFSMQ